MLNRLTRSMRAGLAALLLMGMTSGFAGIANISAETSFPPHPNLAISTSKSIGTGWTGGPSRFTLAGDLNGNGYDDMLRVTSGTLWLYPGTGVNRLGSAIAVGGGWSTATALLGGVDWNLDGRKDLIARFSDGRLVFYPGKGTGRFGGGVQIGHGWQGMRTLSIMQRSIGDRPAIIATDAAGQMHVYPHRSGFAIGSRTTLGGGWGSMRGVYSVGDWDRNGRSDFVAINAAGDLILWAAKSSGTSFTRYQVGHGWSGFNWLAGAQMSARASYLWAATPAGALRSYPVTFTPPQPPTTPVFVYGSLRTGQSNNYLLSGAVSAKLITRAYGTSLYRMSGYSYPWAVANNISTAYTVGEIMYLKPAEAASTIADLDDLELYDPNEPVTNQSYIRVQRMTDTGHYAWMYIAGPRTAAWVQSNGTLVPSGDWLRR